MEAPVDGGTDIHVGFDVNRPDVPIKYKTEYRFLCNKN